MSVNFSTFAPNAAAITTLDICQAIRQFGLPGNLSPQPPVGKSYGDELPPHLVQILARISDDVVYMGMNFIRMTVHDVADNCLDESLSEENRKIWCAYFYLFLRRDIEKEVAIINRASRFISDAKIHRAVVSLMSINMKFGEMTRFLTPVLMRQLMTDYMRELPMWLLTEVEGAQDLLESAGGEISSSVANFLEKSARLFETRRGHMSK